MAPRRYRRRWPAVRSQRDLILLFCSAIQSPFQRHARTNCQALLFRELSVVHFSHSRLNRLLSVPGWPLICMIGWEQQRNRVHLNGKGILIRRAQDKLRRRGRPLVGKPEKSPWVFDPRPARHTADVDFVFALDYCSPNSRLMKLFHEAMSAYGLSCQLVNNINVEKMIEEVEAGRFLPRGFFDLSIRPPDAV